MKSLCIAALLCVGASACVPPTYAQVTPGVAHEDVVYAFEVDKRNGADDTVKVVVCHRFGNPPCVSMKSEVLADTNEYARWRSEAAHRSNVAQRQVKAAATSRDDQPSAE